MAVFRSFQNLMFLKGTDKLSKPFDPRAGRCHAPFSFATAALQRSAELPAAGPAGTLRFQRRPTRTAHAADGHHQGNCTDKQCDDEVVDKKDERERCAI